LRNVRATHEIYIFLASRFFCLPYCTFYPVHHKGERG